LALAAVSTAIVASPAYAEKGDVLVRVRAIVVAPNERSGPVTPAFPGSKVGVSDSVMPEIDFTYMATKHIDSGPLGVDALDHFRITALRLAARTSTHQYRLGIR